MNIFQRFMINVIASTHLIPSKIRLSLYRSAGMKLRTRGIRAKCFFNSTNVSIGENSSINYFCQFHSTPQSPITIGDNCFVAMNVTFCTVTHEVSDSRQRAGDHRYLPITVGRGCWIGANSTILPGVTIGEGCIIAAGSVVNKDCAPNALYAGVPAKRIKDL